MINWRSSLPEICFVFIIVEIWISECKELSNKLSNGSIDIKCETEVEIERVCVCLRDGEIECE